MTRKERFSVILEYFQKHQPVAETELVYKSPYELLVAVILSAQCTDKRVNIITPPFFDAFPTIQSLASGTQEQVFSLIRSCSYPNNKAKHLIGMARYVIEHFEGQIPADTDLLQQIPGVGRKTANVIAAVVFGKPTMAVDTHVFRVSARLGLTVHAKTPLDTELQLIRFIPAELVPIAHHWLILHGRYVCQARKPRCEECGLNRFCRFYELLQKETRKSVTPGKI
jgi:endonuclease III